MIQDLMFMKRLKRLKRERVFLPIKVGVRSKILDEYLVDFIKADNGCPMCENPHPAVDLCDCEQHGLCAHCEYPFRLIHHIGSYHFEQLLWWHPDKVSGPGEVCP